jgi:hypothetical protein
MRHFPACFVLSTRVSMDDHWSAMFLAVRVILHVWLCKHGGQTVTGRRGSHCSGLANFGRVYLFHTSSNNIIARLRKRVFGYVLGRHTSCHVFLTARSFPHSSIMAQETAFFDKVLLCARRPHMMLEMPDEWIGQQRSSCHAHALVFN